MDEPNATIHFDGATGQVVQEIPDAEAVLHGYEVTRPADLAGALWGRDYLKLAKPREGAVYHVRLRAGQGWSCDCGDFEHRNRRERGGGRAPGAACKHCESAEALRELLKKLAE